MQGRPPTLFMKYKKQIFFLFIVGFSITILSAQTDDKKTTDAKKVVKTHSLKQTVKENPDAIYYSVGNSETLYAIAKKNEANVEDIKKWNKISNFHHNL